MCIYMCVCVCVCISGSPDLSPGIVLLTPPVSFSATGDSDPG